jgi:hypothetical protein
VIPETYEIFSGSPENGPLWLESVTGLEAASQRMNERAKKSPGLYFVYCVHSQSVLERVDTSAIGCSSPVEKHMAQKA